MAADACSSPQLDPPAIKVVHVPAQINGFYRSGIPQLCRIQKRRRRPSARWTSGSRHTKAVPPAAGEPSAEAPSPVLTLTRQLDIIVAPATRTCHHLSRPRALACYLAFAKAGHSSRSDGYDRPQNLHIGARTRGIHTCARTHVRACFFFFASRLG